MPPIVVNFNEFFESLFGHPANNQGFGTAVDADEGHFHKLGRTQTQVQPPRECRVIRVANPMTIAGNELETFNDWFFIPRA